MRLMIDAILFVPIYLYDRRGKTVMNSPSLDFSQEAVALCFARDPLS